MPPRRVSAIGNYTREFINFVLKDVEAGLLPRAVCLKYALPANTLDYWLTNFTSPEYVETRRGIFTNQQKRAIGRAVQNGSMTMREAMAIYQLRSDTTIRRWILKDARENNDLVDLNQTSLKKEQSRDQPPGQQAADETEVLHRQLADAKLKIAALNTLIDVAEEQLKINTRKKPGAKRL